MSRCTSVLILAAFMTMAKLDGVTSRAHGETLLTTITRTYLQYPMGGTLPHSVYFGGVTFENLADPQLELIGFPPFYPTVDFNFTANLAGPVRLTSGQSFDAIADFLSLEPSPAFAYVSMGVPNQFSYWPASVTPEGLWHDHVSSDTGIEVDANYAPPNDYSLYGSGMHLSTIEAEMTLLTPHPIYSCPSCGAPENTYIGQINWNVSVDIRFYGVPEPSTALLSLVGSAIFARSRCRRGPAFESNIGSFSERAN